MATAPGRAPGEEAGTANLASSFRELAQVGVALPCGDQVRLRNLIVASGADGRWLLEGKYWERAVSTSAGDLGQRLSVLVKSAAAPYR